MLHIYKCLGIALVPDVYIGRDLTTLIDLSFGFIMQKLSPDMPLQLASDTLLRMFRARVHHHRQGQVLPCFS